LICIFNIFQIGFIKYLNENEEDLLSTNKSLSTECPKPSEQINPFDLFQVGEVPDAETDLGCEPAEKEIGRKLLIEFEHFKLNLNLPLSTPTVTSKSSLFKENSNNVPVLPRTSSIPLAINPELFYISFALFDVRNSQKISENFYCIPNHDIFYSQLIKSSKSTNHLSINNKQSKGSTITGNSSVITPATTAQANETGTAALFSLDGKKLEDLTSLLDNPSVIKRKYLNYVRRALFKIVDVHEEIYLVARIEKCLDGASLHSSIQPYMTQIQNENSRIKTAIKLHKKTQQTIRSRLANYRQPFAWAARPVYKRVAAGFDLDNTQRFYVFEQDVQSLSDDSLLGNLRELNASKDKSCLGGKLVEIPNAEFMVYLNDVNRQELGEKMMCSSNIFFDNCQLAKKS